MTRRRSVVTLLRRLAVRGLDDQVDRRTNVESIVCSEACCLFSSCVCWVVFSTTIITTITTIFFITIM